MRPKKCKYCKKIIDNPKPLQVVCCYQCAIEYSKQLRLKKWKKEKKAKDPELNPTKYKGLLQAEINKLARMIDARFNYLCIDCGKPYGKQTDASHFHAVGGHENIRYNLNNIHSARSYCNQYLGGRQKQYGEGLIKRYGQSYFDYVDTQMGLQYKSIQLKWNEIEEKLKIVRKIIREFDNYELVDGIQARDLFNNLIGIYNGQEKNSQEKQ